MTKKETRKIAKRNILDGKSKQDTFDELRLVCKLPQEELGKIVRQISSLETRQKYRVLNIVLIVLLTLTIVFKMLSLISIETASGFSFTPLIMISILINVLMLLGVSSFHHSVYKVTAILGILALPNMLIVITKPHFDTLYLIDLAMIASFIFLGFYLNSKLFPNYWTEKEIYQNEFGENRMRYILKFQD